MKKQVLTPVLTASLLIILAAVAASAVSAGRITANIPFSFTDGRTTFPAGIYDVAERLALSALVIRNGEKRLTVFVMTPGPDSDLSAKPHVLFHRYGDQNFLARVSLGNGSVYTMSKSRLEREVATGKGNPTAGNVLKAEPVNVTAQVKTEK